MFIKITVSIFFSDVGLTRNAWKVKSKKNEESEIRKKAGMVKR